jgi:CubicO group peptidase (beta-lactamase class C family)
MTGTYVPELQAVDTLLQNFMVRPFPADDRITHNDQVIYERGIGYSNAARTVPMQETALMRLASVSKPVTASAIHQLANDGQLNLNAKVFNIAGNGGILNVTPYNGTLGDSRLRDITVQQLLEHQGGWNRDTAGDLAFRDVQIATAMGVPSPPGIANRPSTSSQPLQFTPGTRRTTPTSATCFGNGVEAASGQAMRATWTARFWRRESRVGDQCRPHVCGGPEPGATVIPPVHSQNVQRGPLYPGLRRLGQKASRMVADRIGQGDCASRAEPDC